MSIGVLQLLPDLAVGGGQQVVLRHARAMDPARIETHVAYFGASRAMAALFGQAGIPVHRIPAPGPAAFPGALRRLMRLARELGIGVLHTHGTPTDRILGLLAARRLGLPLATTLHGLRPRPGPLALRPRALLTRLARNAARALERRLDRGALAAAIAVSDAVREDWAGYLAAVGLAAENIHTVYSGLPLEDYRPPPPGRLEALAAELLPPGAGPVLLAVSRLHPAKRNHLLVPALIQIRRRLPGACLLLAGEGEQRPALEAAAAGLGPWFRLLGDRMDVPALLHLADLVLCPSANEGFGLAGLEALAAGRPVVAADLPQFRLLLAQGAGLALVSEGGAAAFAEAALGLLLDRAGAAALGLRNLDTAKRHWDIRLSARRYEEIYGVLAGRGSASTRSGPNSTWQL